MNARKRSQWFAMGLVTALTVLLGVGYWNLWVIRPVGEGPAGPQLEASHFKTIWSTQPMLLVGIGDSVTAGFGAEPGRSYFDRLARTPPGDAGFLSGMDLSSVFPNFRATNLSVSGSTSPQHIRIQIPKLVRQPTNVIGIVVMTTGGNDLIHNYGKTTPAEGAMFGATFDQAKPWITNFAIRLETMIDKTFAAFPGGCEIFLANIYDPTDGIGDIHKAGLPAWPEGLRIHAEYNRIIAETARRHQQVHLVDIHNAFLGHGIHSRQFWRQHYDRADPHYWFHANLEDPNDRGYDALRRLFLQKMIEVFPANAPADLKGRQ